jgi:5-methylcytosine-specific restriction endonuclease McrA
MNVRRCPACAEQLLQAERERDRRRAPGRDRAGQARFRRAVLQRDGVRCRAQLDDGTRCPISGEMNVVASHVIALRDLPPDQQYNPDNGVTLCDRHHSDIDRYASGGSCSCGARAGSPPWEHGPGCPTFRAFERSRQTPDG